MCDTSKPRLTTAEAAQRLCCKNAAALLLLQAAGVTFTRNTRHGAFLWYAGEVERLAVTLGKQSAGAGKDGAA